MTTSQKLRVHDIDDTHGGTVGERFVSPDVLAGQPGAAWGDITGTLANQTDLQTALNGKEQSGAVSTHAAALDPHPQYTSAAEAAAAAPVQSVSGKTGTVTLLKADVGLGNVDNTSDAAKPVSTAVQTALDGKQPVGSYEPANANIQSHVAAAHAPANAQKNSDITKAEIEAKLTGEISSHSHAGAPGADAWTYVRLGADFTTTSNAAQVVGLSFTPAANQRYEFEASIGIRTATTSVNARVGLGWATGMADGWAAIDEAQSATAQIMARGNINAALLVAVGGLPNTTQSWPVTICGTVIAGANPSGDVRVHLASETNGTTVRVVANSWLKYRIIP